MELEEIYKFIENVEVGTVVNVEMGDDEYSGVVTNKVLSEDETNITLSPYHTNNILENDLDTNIKILYLHQIAYIKEGI